MAPKTGAAGDVAGKAKKAKADKSVVLNVSEYIDREEDLLFERVAIDKELERGQVRPVDETRVKQLADYYVVNPPRVIEVTTWEDPGVCP